MENNINFNQILNSSSIESNKSDSSSSSSHLKIVNRDSPSLGFSENTISEESTNAHNNDNDNYKSNNKLTLESSIEIDGEHFKMERLNEGNNELFVLSLSLLLCI